ncbi:hypothetical protein, partial [Paracraurococcus ruber]|uniref:hypothetical protein n=1 Tax=Paracraurococcus ruber TaxID=77675 RepID=UPI001EFF6330
MLEPSHQQAERDPVMPESFEQPTTTTSIRHIEMRRCGSSIRGIRCMGVSCPLFSGSRRMGSI